jgi:hypothetical protein
MKTMEERQRETDDNWKRMEERGEARRFAPLEQEIVFDGRPGAYPYYSPLGAGGCPSRADPETEGSDHAEASQNTPLPFSALLSLWEAEDEKRKQIERDELKAFNLKYGYKL